MTRTTLLHGRQGFKNVSTAVSLFEKLGVDVVLFLQAFIVYVLYSNCKTDLGKENDHTMMTTPLPVCSAKLSIIGPG